MLDATAEPMCFATEGSATFRPAARFGLIDIVRVAISQQPQIKFLERPLRPSDRLLREGGRPRTEHPRDAVVRQKKAPVRGLEAKRRV